MKPKEAVLLLDHALDSSGSATSHRIRCGLAELYPGKEVLETDEGELDAWELRTSGLAEVAPAEGIPSGLVTRWSGPGAGYRQPRRPRF